MLPCMSCRARRGPALAERGGQGVEDAAFFGGRKFREDGGEARLFLDDQALEGEVGIRAAQLRLALEEIVAADDELEGHRGIEALVSARGLFDRVDERLQLLLRLLEFVMELDDLVERGGLFLRLARLIEKGEQLVGARDRRGAQLDRVVLFRRDEEVAFLLEQLLGRVPPALEFRLAEDVA